MARPGLEPGTPRFSASRASEIVHHEVPANRNVPMTVRSLAFLGDSCSSWWVMDVAVAPRPFRRVVPFRLCLRNRGGDRCVARWRQPRATDLPAATALTGAEQAGALAMLRRSAGHAIARAHVDVPPACGGTDAGWAAFCENPASRDPGPRVRPPLSSGASAWVGPADWHQNRSPGGRRRPERTARAMVIGCCASWAECRRLSGQSRP
jgi:hypothetical protein